MNRYGATVMRDTPISLLLARGLAVIHGQPFANHPGIPERVAGP